MKRRMMTVVLGLAALMIGSDQRSASADDQRPFSADAVVGVVDYYKNGFLTEGIGTATHLGEIDVAGAVRVFGDRSTSTIMLTAANGDYIVLESSSTYDPVKEHFVGDFTVSSGTGRYEGATGYGSIEPVPLGGGYFNVLYDGWISY